MSTETNKPTVGQTFASRWLVRKYEECKVARESRRIQPGLPQPEDLSHTIAEAVDAYVEKKVAELRNKLRAVAVDAAEGNEEAKDQVAFGSNEMLEDPALVGVARQCLNTSMDAIFKFPV